MIRSEIIDKNFSKCAGNYESVAEAQRYAAEKLDVFLDCGIDPLMVNKIYELGCGTGLLTRRLFEKYPERRFNICDISFEMLEKCMEKSSSSALKNRVLPFFNVCDISKSLEEKNYDLVVSSFTFQWIEDLPDLLQRIYGILRPGAFLAFNTLVEPTFETLKNAFAVSGITYPGPRMLREEDIENACRSAFGNIETEKHVFIKKHSDALQFLRQLRQTGAVNASGIPVAPGTLRKIIKKLSSDISSSSFAAEYHILNVKCVKNTEK